MALPNSRASAVLALHVDVFARRVEDTFLNDESFGCAAVDGVAAVEAVTLRVGDGSQFVAEDGAIVLRVPIVVRLHAGAFGPFDCIASVGFAVTAGPLAAGSVGVGATLTFAYPPTPVPPEEHLPVDCTAVPAPFRAQAEAAIRADLDETFASDDVQQQLAALAQPLDLTGALSMHALDAAPALAIGAPTGPGTSLLVGFSVAGDAGTNLGEFATEYTGSDLAMTGDWTLDLDEAVFVDEVQRRSPPVVVVAPTESFPATTTVSNIRFHWTTDPVPSDAVGLVDDYLPIMGTRPLWFVADAVVTTPTVVGPITAPIVAKLLGSVALGVEDGQLAPDPRIESIDVLGFEPAVPGVGLGGANTFATQLPSGFALTARTFSPQNLRLHGIDSFDGASGVPCLFTNSKLTIDNRPRGCSGRLPRDGAPREILFVQNKAEVDAPLWLCDVVLEPGDAPFELDYAPGGPVRTIAPGESVAIGVTFTGDVDDSATATLVLVTNDPERPRHEVELVGARYGDDSPIHARVGCVDDVELIPPQEWFAFLRDFVVDLAAELDEREPDDGGGFVELAVRGLPRDAVVRFVDEDGRTLAASQLVRGGHRAVLPVARGLELGAVVCDARAWAGAPGFSMRVFAGETLGRWSKRGRANDVRADGVFAAAAFDDEIAFAVVTADGRIDELAAVPARDGASFGVVDGVAWVRSTDRVRLLSLGDGTEPRDLEAVRVERDARVDAVAGGFVVRAADSVRVWRVGGDGARLAAVHDVRKVPAGAIPGSARGDAAERSATSVVAAGTAIAGRDGVVIRAVGRALSLDRRTVDLRLRAPHRDDRGRRRAVLGCD